MLLRFFLEKCKTTEEVLQDIGRFPIASAQTITVADCTGNIAVIECNSEKRNVIHPTDEQPFVCAANMFCSQEMSARQNLAIDNWQSETRYSTLVQTLSKHGGKMDIQDAQSLLAGKNGFLCQYDRTTGKDTVWSVIYDIQNKAVYRAEGNPGRKKFIKDERFLLNYHL